jgi:hypothetical protein
MIGVRHVPHRLFTPIFRITSERVLTQGAARGNIASSTVRVFPCCTRSNQMHAGIGQSSLALLGDIEIPGGTRVF